MNPATNDSLARAIQSLGAVEVAPGRYALKHRGRWYATGESGLCVARSVKVRRENLSSSIEAIAKVLPSWWTPERQFAIRSGSLPDVTLCRMVRLDDANSPPPAYKVTADLETGAEVPA